MLAIRASMLSSWKVKLPIVAVLVAASAVLCEAGRVLFGNNIHEVVPGEIYRGAQQSPDDLENLVKRFGIRTVVNLRGLSHSPWCLNQYRRVQELGISQQDLNLSAMRLPPTQEMRRLVEIIDNAEYPIFFHCRRGADRTGLASVIAKLLRTKCGWEEARGQLHWRYGHVAYGRLGNIDEFFDLYAAWLGQQARPHSDEAFRHWLLHDYRGGTCNYEVAEFRRIPAIGTNEVRCARCGEPIAFQVRLRNTGLGTWNLTTHTQGWISSGLPGMGPERQNGAGGEIDCHGGKDRSRAEFARTLVVPGELKPGRYRIIVDLVEESLGWFYQMGAEPMEGELDVCE